MPRSAGSIVDFLTAPAQRGPRANLGDASRYKYSPDSHFPNSDPCGSNSPAMLRPPRLLFIIAASCLTFSALTASAQPSWDDDGTEGGSSEQNTSSSSDQGSGSSAAAADDFADPTAGSGGGGATGGDPDADFGEISEDELDAKLEQLGKYLKDIQAPTRAHTAGWLLINAGLTGFFGYQASYEHSAVRASAIMRSTLSGINLVLTALAPMPGRSAWRKFKNMPQGSVEEKRAKLDAGRSWLSGQVAADKKANEPAQHIVVGLTAIGCGLGLFFGYNDGMRPAVETALGIVLLAELQIATRPKRTRRYNVEFATEKQPAVQMSFAPMMSRWSQGIGLVGRF